MVNKILDCWFLGDDEQPSHQRSNLIKCHEETVWMSGIYLQLFTLSERTGHRTVNWTSAFTQFKAWLDSVLGRKISICRLMIDADKRMLVGKVIKHNLSPQRKQHWWPGLFAVYFNWNCDLYLEKQQSASNYVHLVEANSCKLMAAEEVARTINGICGAISGLAKDRAK